MRRKCREFPLDWLLSEYPELKDSNVKIYIDEKELLEISKVIAENIKKSRLIFREILLNLYSKDLYGKEDVKGKTKGVTGIKYKGKSNDRIYCKEFFVGPKKVVMITTIQKRVQKNDRKITSTILAINKYEYEFPE